MKEVKEEVEKQVDTKVVEPTKEGLETVQNKTSNKLPLTAIIASVLGFAALAILFGFAAMNFLNRSNDIGIKNTPEGFSKHEDNANYTLSYPTDWSVQSISDATYIITSGDIESLTEEPSEFLVLSSVSENQFSDEELETLKEGKCEETEEAIAKELDAADDGSEITSIEKLVVNSAVGCKYVVETDDSYIALHIMSVEKEEGEFSYYLSTFATTSKDSENLENFEKIIKTINVK